MKNFGKNLIIAFLMILAIYQTTELWFENFSGHNFFSFASSAVPGRTQLYGIDKLIISLGDSTALCRSENVLNTAYRSEFDKLIAAAVNKGEQTAEDIDWTNLFNNRCVVYDFSVPMPVRDFCSVLNINSQRLSDLDEVSIAAVIPNTTEDVLRVYVGSGKKTVCCTLKRADQAQKGMDALSAFSPGTNDFNYISSKGNGFNIFSQNTFIPTVRSGAHTTINVENPVMNENMIDVKALESAADGFFDNPAVKWSNVSDNVYSYSDENNVVKYYLNGVLEYAGYNSTETNGEQNVLRNYAAAVDFLKKDSSLQNDVVLTSVSEAADKTVFYFDYSINNTPAVLSGELKAGLKLASAIEVTVSGATVTRSRRYMCVLKESSTKQQVQTDFVNAVDSIYTMLGDESSPVDDVSLAYKITGRHNDVPLSWQIRIKNSTYWEAA